MKTMTMKEPFFEGTIFLLKGYWEDGNCDIKGRNSDISDDSTV